MNKPASAAQPQDGTPMVSDEAIARRAYEISETEESGTSEENWQRAERELREQAVPSPAGS